MLDTTKQKSILYILRKYELNPDHSNQVKKLALTLFDKTQGVLHDFFERERDLLEAGAVLHDIGYYISAKGHHKNSAKIIKEEKPQGFSDEEIEIIANIARYHRGKKPKESHENYAALSEPAKALTRKLSAFVRFADALDNSHLSLVTDLDCIYDLFSQNLFVMLKLNMPDFSLEIDKAESKKDLFEEEFKVKIKFRFE
ncbi:MAG: HD domain-containing protein [bacterium]